MKAGCNRCICREANITGWHWWVMIWWRGGGQHNREKASVWSWYRPTTAWLDEHEEDVLGDRRGQKFVKMGPESGASEAEERALMRQRLEGT